MHTTDHTEALDHLSAEHALTTLERLNLYRSALLIWEHTSDPDERNARIMKLIDAVEKQEAAA